MFGAALLLIGALVGFWMGADARAELASSAHQGTFTVQSCHTAAGGGYDCAGSFAPETGGAGEKGTLHIAQSRAAGDTVRAEDSYADYTRNTYKQIPANRLGGEVLVLGLAVAALAAGLFSLLTGYCPRSLDTALNRWARAYADRHRVTCSEARRRLPARGVLLPVLGVVVALGVLTAATGGVLLALA